MPGRQTSVYEVLHGATGRRRALKVRYGVPATREDRARLRREATLTAGVQSEHLVDVFDVGIDPVNRAPFVIMELLAGESLTTYIDRQEQQRAQATDVVALTTQAATLLDTTHAAGIVHRDVRPENMFVTHRDDGSLRLRLLNFVIADAPHDTQRMVRPFGPPLFLAPEQLEGLPPDHRTDLYALAHVVYAMLVGTPYWDDEATTARSLDEIVTRIKMGATEAPTVRARRRGVTLLPAFDDWFFRATAPAPHRRFDSGKELARELAKSLAIPLDRSTTRAGRDPSCHATGTCVDRSPRDVDRPGRCRLDGGVHAGRGVSSAGPPRESAAGGTSPCAHGAGLAT